VKTLHVTIRLGVGPEDDGAFDGFDAQQLQHALCRAFPLCNGSAIEVEGLDESSVIAEALSEREAGIEIEPVLGGWVVVLFDVVEPGTYVSAQHTNIATALGLAFAKWDDALEERDAALEDEAAGAATADSEIAHSVREGAEGGK